MNKKNTLLIFGFGYTAKFICKKFSKKIGKFTVQQGVMKRSKKLNTLKLHQFFLMMKKK